MTPELMLPTWEAASKMRFDCDNGRCVTYAKYWAGLCGHGLVVCHQRIGDDHQFQVVIRHGESEAVLIASTSEYALDAVNAEVIEWLGQVHEYEASRA